MTRPRVYKTEAIVLKRSNLGEADSLLTLYTRESGKTRAVARGMRKPKSKLGGHLEPLTQSVLILAKGHSLDVVTQCQTIEPFLPLRSDLWRTVCALYAAELVDQFSAEGSENAAVYDRLRATLVWVCETGSSDLALRFFELHLLRLLGYLPELHHCVSCLTALEPGRNVFSAGSGGVLCPACASNALYAHPLSVDALKVMRFILSNNQASVRRLKIGADLAWELEQLMRGYIRYILEREVKSVEFMDRLRSPAYLLRSTT